MDLTKENLEKLVLNDKLSYSKIGKMHGISGVAVRKKCISFDIEIPVRSKFKDGYEPHNKGERKNRDSSCEFCGNLYPKEHWKQRFCSVSCSGKKGTELKINHWIENPDSYINSLNSPHPGIVKPYILNDQDKKCKICGMENNWNGMSLNFVLDHIDGNAANNRRDNLRLVCHNCDSQLPTYKSKNKNSARTERYKKMIS